VRRTQITNILLLIAAAFVGYLCFQMARPFLVAISWAAVLAILLEPVQNKLEARIKRPSVAAGICCFLVVIMGLLPAVAIAVSVGREVSHLMESQGIEAGDYNAVKGWVVARLQAMISWLSSRIGVDDAGIAGMLVQAADQARTFLVDQTKTIVGGVAGFFFNVIVIIFTLFFFLRDRRAVVDSVRGFMPLSLKNANEVLARVREVIVAAVMGGGAVSVSQGVIAGLGFLVLGVPAPLLWGVATSIFSLIPLVGAAGVWIPMTLVLLFDGHPVKALVLALYGMFVISMIDNFLRPIFIGQTTQLHTLLIFFSILGGIQIFGFLGIVMGPVVLALGLALVEIIRRDIGEEDERRRLTGEMPRVG
jgi:predicted PurR-regulated permease PerM